MELAELKECVIEGEAAEAKAWTAKAIESGFSPLDILNRALVPAMAVVGQRFSDREYYFPEMLIAAAAMESSLTLLRPLLARDQHAYLGRVAIGTVAGDVHDLGKNIVLMMLEGAGFEVHDLGVNVAPGSFVDAANQSQVDILALSALLTTSMPMMETTIKALEAAGVRSNVKVMVGGAPVTEDYARKIGADGYAPDAVAAVEKAKELVYQT